MVKRTFIALAVILTVLSFFLFDSLYKEAGKTAITKLNEEQMIHAKLAAGGIKDFFTTWTRIPVHLGNTFWPVAVASFEKDVLSGLASFRNKPTLIIGALFFCAMVFSILGAKTWLIVREKGQRRKIENDLLRSEERLRLVLEANSEGVWDWNIPSGQAVFSPRYSGMLGYEPDEFPKNYASWKELVHPDDFERVNAAHAEHINEGKEFCVELRMRKKSGGWCWILSRGMVVEKDAGGRAVRMVGTHLDISNRKQAEMALVESEKRYRMLFESAPAGILLIGSDGYVRAANSLQARLYGCESPRELAGMYAPMFIAEREREQAADNMNTLLAGKELPDRTYTAVRRDGSEFIAEVTSVILRGDREEVQGYLCLTRDITERRRAEKQLEDRFRFEKLLNTISTQFINISIDGLDDEIKAAQQQICECLGLDISALWQFSPDNPDNLFLTHYYVPPGFPVEVPETMKASESFPWSLEKMMKKEPIVLRRISDAPRAGARDIDGWKHFGIRSVLTYPLYTGEGPVFGALNFNVTKAEQAWSEELVSMLQVVSEIFASALNRKFIERNLRESEARLSDITFSMADWIWELDEKGVYTYSSAKGFELFGHVLGKTPFDFMPPDEAKRVAGIFSGIAANREPIKDLENWNIRKDGERICLLTNGVPVMDENGNLKGYRGVDKDITGRKRSVEALKRSEHLLAETEKIGKVGGWEFNVETGKQTWTEEVYIIHEVDLSYEPTVEKGVNFYTPASRPIIEQSLQRAIEHGEPFALELDIVTAKGNLKSVHVIGETDLEHQRVYGFFQDITERRLAETARGESMAHYQAIVEAFDGLIYICAPDYRIEFMNQRLIERSGRNAVGEFCYKALHDRDSVCEWCVNERVFQGETVRWEVQSPRDGGWYFVVNSPIRHVDGTISKQAMIMDITERKRAEAALLASEERFRALAESALVGIYVLEEGKYAYVNPAMARVFGYSVAEMTGMSPREIVQPCDHGMVNNNIQRRIAGEVQAIQYEVRGRHRDSSTRDVEVYGTRVEMNGRPALVGTLIDITERKRAEAALEESRAQIAAVMNSTRDFIWSVDPERFGLVTWNRAFMDYFFEQRGIELEVGMTPQELVPPDYVPLWNGLFSRALREEFVITEYVVVAQTKTLLLSLHAMRRDQGAFGISVFGRDITELKRAEEELLAEKNKLQSIMSAMNTGITIRNQEYELIYQNDYSLNTFGNHLGERCYRVFAGLDRICDDCPVEKAFKDGKSHSHIKEVEMLAGKITFWENTAVPMRDGDGNIHACLEINNNITERKKSEKALIDSESALRNSQKDLQKLAGRLISAQEEELRRLSRELHDDLTQRLAVLAIDAGKLELDLGKKPEACPEVSRKILQIKEQLISVSEDVHNISRQLHPTILDDLGLIRAIESECAALMRRENIEINFSKEDVPDGIANDISLCLYRVLQESLKNVVTHSRATSCEIFLEGVDSMLLLTVSDNGVGFDPSEVRNKAGLGLSSMRERAQLVEGDFSVKSRPGQGTIVRIGVPLKAGVM